MASAATVQALTSLPALACMVRPASVAVTRVTILSGARPAFPRGRRTSPLREPREQPAELAVEFRVRREDRSAEQRIGPAPHLRDEPPGLADEEDPRRHVPGGEPELPEPVEPPAGRVGEVEGRRPEAPHPPRQQFHADEVVEVVLPDLVPLVREPGAEEGPAEV